MNTSLFEEFTNVSYHNTQIDISKVQVAAKQKALANLRRLLLEEDRRELTVIKQELLSIKRQLGDEMFSQLVTPIVEEQVAKLKHTFPEVFGPLITKTIKEQVTNSEKEIVDALYPVLGKMIRRFIQAEFRKWIEELERRAKKVTGWQLIRNQIKILLGHSESEPNHFIGDKIFKQIEEIFIIEKDTGFILASYSDEGPFGMNKEMLVGMLTALKSFGEDAMGQHYESLGTIQYDGYNIVIVDFYSYFAATIVNGPVSEHFKSKLYDNLLDFADKYLKDIYQKADQANEQQLSQVLKLIISDNK